MARPVESSEVSLASLSELRLIARGELEPVTGAAAGRTPLLEHARRTAATAAALVSSDAYSAYLLAYDATRFACIARERPPAAPVQVPS